MRRLLLASLLSLLCSSSRAAEVVATTCSSADVQTAIDRARSGDVVRLPAPCSETWSTAVMIPGTKGIVLDGQGAKILRDRALGNSTALRLTAHPTAASRITGFNFSGSGKGGNERFVQIDTTTRGPDAKFRLDHTSFASDFVGIHVLVYGAGYGLIDHCRFTWSGNDEVIQHQAYGASDPSGWNIDVVPGSADALYVEDNTFTNNRKPNFSGGKTAGFNGSKMVIRFNEIGSAELDQHGTRGALGARWWEHYRNTFHVIGAIDKWHQIRGGTGMIWGDHSPACVNGCGLVLWEEDPGYPAAYQIGRGKCSGASCGAHPQSGSDQALDPAYIWLRDSHMPLWTDEASPKQIVANRDYYAEGIRKGVTVGSRSTRPSTCTPRVAHWSTDQGGNWDTIHGGENDGCLDVCTATNTWQNCYYTPYTYPHPLQGVAPSP